MENYIGRLLDNRYEILEVIGTGGMAVVYRALDHRLNRAVAVKILKDEFSRNEEFRRRFHAESQAVAMLSHPNIVSVYDVSHSENADYIVMELIEGISLKQYLEKKGNLNWRETLHFSMQIAKALDHAHSRGIVHRDIKPHNIMILKDGSIKVADFGIARVGSAKNTLTREALGSVHYISPEQAKGARVDNRSDLYSLGVVMYEMLTGRTPYDGETPVSVAIQHINGGARRPSELAAGVPLGLEYITMRAMSADPDKRYSSAADMLHDMEEFRKNPSLTFMPSMDGATTVVPKTPAVVRSGGGMPRSEAERYAAARAAKTGAMTPEQRRAERARREAEKAEEKRKKTMIIAILSAAVALALIAVIVVIAAKSGGGSPTDGTVSTERAGEVQVPNFVGEPLDNINPDDYPDLKIDLQHVTEAYSDKYEKGYVMDQTPRAYDIVKSGREIKLTVSMGKEEIKMPDLVDMTDDNAMATLQALNLGLKIKIKDESSKDIRQGNIVRTEPKAEETLESGQEVVLYVSLGENKMPNLKGDTEENARARLNALKIGVQIEVLYDTSDEYEKDRVFRTDPEAGEQLEPNQKIFLYVSKGSGKVRVPKVIGQSRDAAEKTLTDLKLTVVIVEIYDDVEPQGTVISQSILPDTEVKEGTQITIDVSKGKDPSKTEPTAAPTEPTEPTEAPEPTEKQPDEPTEAP
ncbi:MAG: Stk1 family PASTA domain-containing Ser/Thr kinase [Oscillospiraceae bacterium]|nr:Stk1 family PASTA domain-containing Ser/Thr kinase [Oscillospiraceae bacterium]